MLVVYVYLSVNLIQRCPAIFGRQYIVIARGTWKSRCQRKREKAEPQRIFHNFHTNQEVIR